MLLGVMQPRQETPAGTIDGDNRTFTLAAAPIPGTLAAYMNGLFLTPGVDYTVSMNTITYAEAPQPSSASYTGDKPYAQYLC